MGTVTVWVRKISSLIKKISSKIWVQFQIAHFAKTKKEIDEHIS